LNTQQGSIDWEHSEEEGWVIRIKPGSSHLLCEDLHVHASSARKEILLAMQSLIDLAVKKMDEKENSRKGGGSHIKVE
jgi:hypothetical protein